MHIIQKQKDKRSYIKAGFSLAEILIVLVIASVLILATLPVLTELKLANANINQNVLSCMSTSTSAASCSSSQADCVYDRNNSCEDLIGYAISGSTTALTILKSSCDYGATKACDYLIQSCVSAPNFASTSCTSSSLSINYYLNLPITSTSPGQIYMTKRLQMYCTDNVANIVGAVTSDWNTSSPNTSWVAYNFVDNNCIFSSSTSTSSGGAPCSGYTILPSGAGTGFIEVSLCNNSYNPVANNSTSSTAEC